MNIGILLIRSGSKGIKNKNIREMAGKPLFYWILKAATEANELDKIIVSSDSELYLTMAQQYFPSIVVKKRLKEDATDNALEVDAVYNHICTWRKRKLKKMTLLQGYMRHRRYKHQKI